MSMPNYFAFDPFQRRTRTMRYAPQGDQDTWSAYDREEEYWDLSDALRGADPRLAENWSNPNNMEVTRDGDGYRVRIKTGDKEGTWYNLTPDGNGGFTPSVAGRGEWNTNENLFDDPIALAMMAAVGTIGAGAAGAFGGLPGGSAPIVEGGTTAALGGAAPVAESFPVAAYGPSLTAPLNPATISAGGVATGAAGLAGPYTLGNAGASALQAAQAFSAANPGVPAGGAAAAGGGAGAAAGGSSSLVKTVADALGISEDVARLIVGLGPAVVTGIGNLLEDDEDNQVTRTGNPTIDAAREQVVTRMIGGLDERIARDRARSDKLAGWSDAAAAIPQGLPQYRGLMETDELGRVRFRRPRGLTGA
jgi:hypothetical protein